MKKQNSGNLYNKRNQPIAWIFVAPFVFGVITYFAYVIYSSVAFSLSNLSMGDSAYILTPVGLGNYKKIFTGDLNFIRLALSNVGMMLYKTPVILLFSLLMAVFLNGNIPGRTVFRAIFFLPVVTSVGIIASLDGNNLIMQTVTNSGGINTGAGAAGQFLSTQSIEQFISGLDFSPALVGYVTDAVNNILEIVNQSGVQIIIFLAGLQAISPSIYEYAKTEGATGWEIFWKITFPLIMPMMLVNLFYTVVDMVTSSENTVVSYIKNVSFNQAQFGLGSAMAWIYFMMIAFVIIVFGGLLFYIVRRSKNAV